MATTIFFSWQADTPTREGRNFIEKALEHAVARISGDAAIEEPERGLQIDRDTKGVPGSPPIVDTILRKIDQAAVFLPDFTFIAKRPDGRPTPNPNVLIEYGWALRKMGHGRIVAVMNTTFGEPDDTMPFDLRHLRNPIRYHCPADLDETGRKRVRDQLAKDLEGAIRTVLDSQEFRDSLPKPAAPPPFIPKEPADGRGRFRSINEPLGLCRDVAREPRRVYLAQGPVSWFRMMPTIDPGRTWSVAELASAMQSPFVSPVSEGWSGYNFVRGADGFGIYAVTDDPATAVAVVFAFTTGEIWSIDTYWLRAHDGKRIVPTYAEPHIRRSLIDYGKFLARLDIKPPYKWVAGMEDLTDRLLYAPTPPNRQKLFQHHDGECLVSEVIESGLYSPDDLAGAT